MFTRRNFIKRSSFAGLSIGLSRFSWLPTENNYAYTSDYIKLELAKEQPQLIFFSTDSLGKGKFLSSPLLKTERVGVGTFASERKADTITYYKNGNTDKLVSWQFDFYPNKFSIKSRWQGEVDAPFIFSIAQKLNHSTVLGIMKGENQVAFPAVLHLPGMGSFRITCSDPQTNLLYDAYRFHSKGEKGEPYVKLSLPAASADRKEITYHFESVAIYPRKGNLEGDDRFEGYRRNYINIFQLNPRLKVLANNSASDACAFTLYLYAEMARKTPELGEGLTAMDLIRNSVEQYLNGMKGYGQVGYNPPYGWLSIYNSSDSAPSLVISACYYVLESGDSGWAKKNYEGIRNWVTGMMKEDKNNNGLIEYGHSGNSGSWGRMKKFQRPSNWWDSVGFGHEDAYSNALAYRALNLIAQVAEIVGEKADHKHFSALGRKLKSNYFKTFYNPSTGILAGWKSADGMLHDYYFTFVNGVAITYGLVEGKKARKIMQRILEKMKEVGFKDFRLGLPGNLIPISDDDYAHKDPRWGYQKFQVYENGGASGCFAYFTIESLYKLRMRKEADSILFPMLQSFKEGGFEGKCEGGQMTKDWKTWTGECWGYEGFLVDNYLPLLAVNNSGPEVKNGKTVFGKVKLND